MISGYYIKESIWILNNRIKDDNMEFNNNTSDINYPFSVVKYRPELANLAECTKDQIRFLHNLFGVLNLII